MSAEIYAHPRLSALQISLLCQVRALSVEYEFFRGRRLPLVKLQPLIPAPSPAYQCVSCGWQGLRPALIDTQDFFQPPRGEVPGCPRCDSLNLRYPQVRSCQTPP